ncbi:MAG TPA: murein biosynthesis integral membrane protein MurJ, partial [bacterium]|nr:murein biosynthesis integral membrane protein MurJ [bacterium]
AVAPPPSQLRKLLRLLNPSHQHSARSATILVMAAVFFSRIVGFLRESYIASAFGAGSETDAYVAAFTLPNILVYMLAGGSISTTFITIYNRFIIEKKPEEGDKTFSVVVTVMSAIFGVIIIAAEIWARPLCALLFPKFDPAQLALTASMTRILLPMELFIYIGSVVQGVLYAKRLFLVPAITPIIFNLGIIAGGMALSGFVGVPSLAIGALTGAAVGPLALASVAAWHAGLRYRPSFDHRNAAFREWALLTLPLMIGVSLVSADEWIIRIFASSGTGDIARLNFAKRLFGVPSALLNQAIGQASLPFFARLFAERRFGEFGKTVNDSVSRSVSAALVVSTLMMTAALPAVDIVYRRHHFTFEDSLGTSLFFLVFSLSLAFWPAQGLYSRAFYSANDTLTPMIATTVITAGSIPIYGRLYSLYGAPGLAFASDIGIGLNTVVLALLLHWRGHVRLSGLRWGEMAKALVAAVLSGGAAYWVAKGIPVTGSRLADVASLSATGLTWGLVAVATLLALRSDLPRDLLNRGRVAPPPAPPPNP